MRRTLLILISFISPTLLFGDMNVFAQLIVEGKNFNGERYVYFFDYPHTGYTVLDSILLRVNYLSDFAIDTTSGLRIKETSTLEIGKHINKFYHFQYFETDSLLKLGSELPVISNILYEDISYPLTFFEAIYQNYPEDRLTCTGRVITQDFLYEEDMPEMGWSISDSTKNILNMVCFKATCRFRGRDYTAWFTPDIPAMSGPWKFSGLPGLILEVYDSRREYIFTALELYRTRCSIDLPDKMYVKTKRANYIKAKRLMLTNAVQASRLYLVNSRWKLMGEGTDRLTPMNYDFIEKD